MPSGSSSACNPWPIRAALPPWASPARRPLAVTRLTDLSLSGRRGLLALARPDGSRSYAAAESVKDGGARTGRDWRVGRGIDARSADRTALATITVGSGSRSTVRATTAVAEITVTTTSSRSATSYIPPSHSGSGGLASARGKMANRRTRRPRAYKLLHRPATWPGRTARNFSGMIRATHSAPSAKGTDQFKAKENCGDTTPTQPLASTQFCPYCVHERSVGDVKALPRRSLHAWPGRVDVTCRRRARPR